MPLTLPWYEVIARLALALAAGAVLGANRGERGHPAGLRTTVLVCLAACGSMVQVNLLLVLSAERQSLVTLDLMRLPLGILSGMGFIGAGAILQKGEIVHGITTAATLWFVTVMGVCFGGGQLTLGLELTVLGVVVLSAMKWVERRILFEHRAELSLVVMGPSPTEAELRGRLESAQLHVERCAVGTSTMGRVTLTLSLRWRNHQGEEATPAIVGELSRCEGVRKVSWEPIQ